jgi:hypothetical protein
MAWMAEGNREKNNCDQRDAIEHSSNTGVTQYDLASCCVQCSVSASSAESSAESSRHQEHDLEQRERDLLCGSSRRADAAQRAAQQLKELLSSSKSCSAAFSCYSNLSNGKQVPHCKCCSTLKQLRELLRAQREAYLFDAWSERSSLLIVHAVAGWSSEQLEYSVLCCVRFACCFVRVKECESERPAAHLLHKIASITTGKSDPNEIFQ